MNPRIMSLKMREVRQATGKGKPMRFIYLSKDEKDFLKLYKKMKAPRDEIIQLMKTKDLRKFVIEKYTADCPFHSDCPWCKLERKDGVQDGALGLVDKKDLEKEAKKNGGTDNTGTHEEIHKG